MGNGISFLFVDDLMTVLSVYKFDVAKDGLLINKDLSKFKSCIKLINGGIIMSKFMHGITLVTHIVAKVPIRFFFIKIYLFFLMAKNMIQKHLILQHSMK